MGLDGIYSGLRADDQRLCALVVIGANERGQRLPFLKAYRTMCIAPGPEFRRLLQEVQEMRLAA